MKTVFEKVIDDYKKIIQIIRQKYYLNFKKTT